MIRYKLVSKEFTACDICGEEITNKNKDVKINHQEGIHFRYDYEDSHEADWHDVHYSCVALYIKTLPKFPADDN